MKIKQGIKILNSKKFQWGSHNTMELIKNVETNEYFIVNGFNDKSHSFMGTCAVLKKILNGCKLIAKIYDSEETAIEITKQLNKS